MPSLRTRAQQPSPVSPQVPVPNDFPAIPKSVLERFPEAADWQKRLDEFWTRTNQALQEAQNQTAKQANSQVVFSVDRFLIYAKNGIPQPMFALDATGVKLGDVLVVNTPGRKVYIGEGNYADADTPFYIDTLGNLSLGANLTWDAETSTLTITGTINATSGTIGGFTIGADYIRDVANSMGLSSTVTGGDDVRFWAGDTFANRAAAPFRVTELGAVTATSGTIGGYTIEIDNLQSVAGLAGISSVITGGDDVRFWAGDTFANKNIAPFRVTELGALVATSATISGNITATTGAIGGFVIGSDYIRDVGDFMGMASTATGADDVRFWAGSTYASRATAPFRVTELGVIVATSATISGNITATTGAIGGFDIGSDYLRDAANSFGLASTATGGDDVRLWAGAAFASRATAPFRVTEAGALVATSATISGTITSSSGTIGGFTLSSTAITAGSGDNRVELASDVTGKPENSALILGVTSSNNYYTYLGRGGLWMTYAAAPVGDDYPGIKLYVDSGTNGCGVLELSRNTASASRLTLEGESGTIVATGAIRTNDKFNNNGVDGASGTFDPTAITFVDVRGGIIVAWS